MSDSGVDTHHEVEAVLHALHQYFSVVNVNTEFSFNGIVDEDACFNIDLVILTVPVGLERDGHSVPPVRVQMSKSFSNYLNNSLCQYVGLHR